jgi:hypothetical protein
VSLKLTPHILRAAYELLSITEPFCRWNLPEGEDIVFKVARDPHTFGWHVKGHGQPHTIAVSAGKVSQLPTLLETMAHEMVHVHEFQIGLRGKNEKTVAFKKFSAQVCRVHTCFDPKSF